jgi:hypothetical protein
MDAWQGIESRRTYADFRARVDSSRLRGRRWLPIPSLSPRWAAAALVAIAFLGGGASGVYRSSHVAPHAHVVTAEIEQLSESLGLDAFDGGLSDALIAVSGEVTE